jgi:hypothetical protein
MSTYYVEKDVGQIGPFLAWLETSHELEQKSNVEPPVVAFLAGVFADNPDRIRGWIAPGTFSGKTRIAVERALWLSHHGGLIADVFHDTPEYAPSEPPSLLAIPLKSPDSFDMMWGSFFATGNVAYPERLIDVLDETQTLTGNAATDGVLRSTAAWSLKSNMWQHELIDRMARREAGLRTGAVQKQLQSMIAGVEGERPSFQDRSGDFGALLVLVSEDNLKEFDKPSDQGVMLNELDKAKPGDHIAVKIGFAGMAIADDLKADVTYDLKIVGPNGKIYDGVERANLEALKQKTPLRFAIFDNRGVMIVRFEPNDARGTYNIFAVVHDNIGHRSIALSKQIELTD